MVIKVGINGFGRIGRVIFRTCISNSDIELVAINDPAIDIDYICYLIKFDSTHGKFKGDVSHTEDEINVDDQIIKVFREKLPPSVPWQTAGVQYVIEASGMFTCLEKASGHLIGGSVKRVIVTAPSVDVPMIILGVNDGKLSADQKVLSCASSTLYCLAPIVKVLEDSFGVTEGFVTSIHAMTPSLKPLDGLCLRGKHWRDHRSIHQNIIPATTGACKALSKIIPQVKDKMSGLAFRVPIVNVSVLDLTVRLDKNTNIQDIIKSVDRASKSFLQNIIKISKDEAVSSDFSGDSHSCILDADSSLQLKPNFFKIICWYENEYSYACRVLDSIFFSENQFNKPVRLPCKMSYVREKLSITQDEVQQTDRNIKEMSIECNYNNEDPKISASQEAALKRKPRPLVLRKPLSSHSSGATTATAAVSAINRDTKKRNELFKIWNDNNDAQKNTARQNRNSFFQSCTAFGTKNSEQTDCIKAQERLESVKKEFSKMVNITEGLLKKSYNNKKQLESFDKNSLDGVKLDANGELKTDTIEGSITEVNEPFVNPPTGNLTFEYCGDYKNRVVLTPATDCSKEEVRGCNSSERNENISDYNITGEKKNQNKKTCLQTSHEEDSIKNLSSIENFGRTTTANNTLRAKVSESTRKSVKSVTESMNLQERIGAYSSFVDGLSNNFELRQGKIEQKEVVSGVPDQLNSTADLVEDSEIEIQAIDYNRDLDEPRGKIGRNVQTSAAKIYKELETPENEDFRELNKYLHNKDYNIHVVEEELKKRNIVLINSHKEIISEMHFKICSGDSEHVNVEFDERRRNMNLNKQILESLNRLVPEPAIAGRTGEFSGCCSPGETMTTISNGDGRRNKLDLYDKLDSASGTDSNNSFEINERKSQVIHITDLTNSLEDLARLDKICRIIEISDELSDKLFSSLDRTELKTAHQKKWSFRDLCERIHLDEFCNKVFGTTNS